jgi:glycosyltransferase involved in cell wall biosynthesis
VHGSSVVGKQIKDSVLINNSFECRYINLGTSKSIYEIGRNPLGKIFTYLNILKQVFQNLIIFKPQICYLALTAKGLAFYKDAVVIILIKLFGKKLIYHFHNKGVITRQDKFVDNLLYKIVFRNTDVILLSKYLYPDVKKYVSEERVCYCPNGIPDIKNQLSKVSPDKRIVEVLFLSNLIESKGVFVLLKAYELLGNKKLPYHCTFIGDEGNISAKQFHLIVLELGLSNKVSYLGPKYSQERNEVFSNADILVHPTHEDCFPLNIIEAMQFCLPVVSTFEGGIPDIVEDSKTGFLVPPKDSHALAQKLEILINDPELRRQMGITGRKRYEENFTLQHFEKRLVAILRTATNENN